MGGFTSLEVDIHGVRVYVGSLLHRVNRVKSRNFFSRVDICIGSNEHTLAPLIYIDYVLFTGSEWSQSSDSSDMGIHIVDT